MSADLHADLTNRWRPDPGQIAEAEAVLADKGSELDPRDGAVYTLHLLTPKHYGFWTADVEVIPMPGVYMTRDAALVALEAHAGSAHATTGQPVVGGYTRHTARGWAVFEDICSAYPKDER